MYKNFVFLINCITRQGFKSLANRLNPLSAFTLTPNPSPIKREGNKSQEMPFSHSPSPPGGRRGWGMRGNQRAIYLPTASLISKRAGSLTIIFLLSLVIIACSDTNISQIQSSTPANQTGTRNQESVQKVVTLTPLTTDIIYQLDKTKLVGVPGNKLTSNDPRFKELPSVSGERTPPNLEKIVALKPDLVIGSAGFHNQTMDKLNQLGIKTQLTQVNNWKALEELTENLARSLNANPEPLLKRYQSFLADLPNQNLSTLVLVSRQPILSPNKESWAGDLIAQFKVKNVSAQLQGNNPIRGYVTLSAEKILEANPELIFLVDNGDGILEKFKSDSFWNQLKAVKNNRVHVFDYYGFVNPGSIDSIEKTCSQLRQILATKV